MGASQSSPETPKGRKKGISCADGTCLNKAGHYRADYLKAEWADTDRAGYRYSIGYAPTGAATCAGCKAKIAKGSLRIGRSVPNPFDAEGGTSDYTKFMHPNHAFDVMLRSRCSSNVPGSTRDLAGFASVAPADKRRVAAYLADFRKAWTTKCQPSRLPTPSSRKAKA